MRKLFFIALLFSAHISLAQKPDTTFLLKEYFDDGAYHAVFIDSSENSKYYDQISDFEFGEFDQQSYDNSLKYMNEHNVKLTKIEIKGVPKQWITLKYYQGKFYTYKPSDFLFHYQVGICDSAYIAYTGEGPEANKINSYKKINNETFLFELTGSYREDRKLFIYMIDKKRGIAVFEEEFKDGRKEYALMIQKEKIKMVPMIVNYCMDQKVVEFNLEQPDYEKLLKAKK